MLDHHLLDQDGQRPAQASQQIVHLHQIGVDTPPVGLYAVDATTVRSLESPLIRIKANGFFYCTSGSATLLSDDRTLTLESGQLYVYTPHRRTEVLRSDDGLRGIVGIADFDFVQAALTITATASHRLTLIAHPAIALDDAERRSFERLLEAAMTPLGHDDSQLGRLRLAALGQAICYEILHLYELRDSLSRAALGRRDLIFDRFLQHIREQCREHRDIAHYARLQCITPGYLAAAVRYCSGRSPQDWLSAAVIAEARRLLAEPQLSIKEISQALNFPSQTFFGSYFRRHTGLSPSAARKAR